MCLVTVFFNVSFITYSLFLSLSPLSLSLSLTQPPTHPPSRPFFCVSTTYPLILSLSLSIGPLSLLFFLSLYNWASLSLLLLLLLFCVSISLSFSLGSLSCSFSLNLNLDLAMFSCALTKKVAGCNRLSLPVVQERQFSGNEKRHTNVRVHYD